MDGPVFISQDQRWSDRTSWAISFGQALGKLQKKCSHLVNRLFVYRSAQAVGFSGRLDINSCFIRESKTEIWELFKQKCPLATLSGPCRTWRPDLRRNRSSFRIDSANSERLWSWSACWWLLSWSCTGERRPRSIWKQEIVDRVLSTILTDHQLSEHSLVLD